MNDNKSFGDRLEAFFEGKGFYIVLFLCAAVIGVSAWVLVMGTNVDGKISDVRSAGVEATPEIIAVPPAPVESIVPTTEPEVTAKPGVVPEDENAAQVWNEQTEPQSGLYVMPVNGEIITPHAVDKLIYDKTMEDWRTHSGIDIAAPLGTHVLSVSDGKVNAVVSDAMYGTTVIIEHTNGVESIYSNLAAQPTVYVGDAVTAGQVIGGIGETAICESAIGAHLHFSMRKDGIGIDPHIYLP